MQNKELFTQIQNTIQNSNHNIKQNLEHIKQNLELIKQNTTKTQYRITLQRSMQKALAQFISDPTNTPKIQKLCQNLDPKSCALLFQIFSRVKNAYLNPKYQVKFTQEEQKIQSKLEKEFFPHIINFAKDIWGYDGYFLPIKHFEVGVFYHKHSLNIFSEATLKRIKNEDIIDVGGFIGDSAIIFEKEFSNKNIHTFEATKSNFILLEQTLKLNQSQRIIPINKGLGAKEEKLFIQLNGSSSSIHENAKNAQNSEEISIITLDSYVKENNVKVGFIKVDIEGFEQEFLKGAKQTIMEQKPAMLISIYHNPSDFFDIKPLIESWNLGYSFQIHKSVDYSVSIETALFCEVKS